MDGVRDSTNEAVAEGVTETLADCDTDGVLVKEADGDDVDVGEPVGVFDGVKEGVDEGVFE